MMNIYESGEDYLETIYKLNEEHGHVRSIDIARELNYSKPSVSRAMSILKERGLIEITDREITLTEPVFRSSHHKLSEVLILFIITMCRFYRLFFVFSIFFIFILCYNLYGEYGECIWRWSSWPIS